MVSQRAWGLELPVCEHVGLCKFGPFVSSSALVFRNTNLETRPSTGCSPACFEIIQLQQLLPLYAGLPRINPLPFKVLIGCAYVFVALRFFKHKKA